MATLSDDELIAVVKDTIDLIRAHGYELKVDGCDLDLHDGNGEWVTTVGTVELD